MFSFAFFPCGSAMLTHFGGIIKRVNEQIIQGGFAPEVVHFMLCPQTRRVAPVWLG
jgi:hypothetical protein